MTRRTARRVYAGSWRNMDEQMDRMAEIREQAKKALPSGATDAQVAAEIEGNPQKYPAWRELVAALEKNAEESQRNRATAAATVRRRILRETTERTSAKQ